MSNNLEMNSSDGLKILVDFHVHTHYSMDSLTSPEKLLMKLNKRVDRIVVTDHNTIAGALEAKAMNPKQVIVGEEIMTTCGEILAAYVQEEIPAGLTPKVVVRMLREQNAFISISHPFDSYRKGSWRVEELLPILGDIDAIEGFNARVMYKAANQAAMKFAVENEKLITAGSDAHTIFEVGKAGILMDPFSGVDEMRKNLRNGLVTGSKSSWWVHLFSTYAKNQKKQYKG